MNVVEPSLLHGEMCHPTLLNLAHDVQDVLIGGKYYKIYNPSSGLVDSNPLEGRRKFVEYYTDRDLDLGVTLKMFGSDVFLYDSDAFTKNYYLSTYNKELKPVPRPEVKPFYCHKLVYKRELFGEPEQTIRTNDPFTPIRYMTDLKKFFKYDKYGYDVRELKFLAHPITEEAIQKHRVFMVRWFLEDDTMDMRAVDLDFDNQGMMEHKYLKRMKMVKPQNALGNFERCYYQPSDMYVGNTIYVRSRPYYLVDADEYTYDYMERNCHIFHHSNIKRIMTKLRQWAKDNSGTLKSCFEKKDPKKTGFVNYDDFRSGCLTPKRLYYAMRSSSIPIKRDLLKSFIYKFPTEDGNIKYMDVINSIDWIKNNTQYEKEDPHAIQINWEHKEYERDLDKIKYNSFLSDAVL